MVILGVPIPIDTDHFFEQLDDLMDAAYKNKIDIKERVEAIVPTYKKFGGGSETK